MSAVRGLRQGAGQGGEPEADAGSLTGPSAARRGGEGAAREMPRDARDGDGRAGDGRFGDSRSVDGRGVDGRSGDGRSVDGRSGDGTRRAGRGRPTEGGDARAQPALPLPLFHRVLPAEAPAIRRALTDLTCRFRDSDSQDAMARLELVLAEVLNNLAQHGTGRGKGPVPPGPTRDVTVHLCVTRHDGGLACAVTDDGPPLPKNCIDPGYDMMSPDDAALRGGGFGWLIIRDLTQALFHFRDGKRNVLCFNVPL